MISLLEKVNNQSKVNIFFFWLFLERKSYILKNFKEILYTEIWLQFFQLCNRANRQLCYPYQLTTDGLPIEILQDLFK